MRGKAGILWVSCWMAIVWMVNAPSAQADPRDSPSLWLATHASDAGGAGGLSPTAFDADTPIATDRSDAELFVQTLGTPRDDVWQSVAAVGNGFVAAGYTVGTTTGKDVVIARFDSGGTTLWRRVYGGNGDDEARSILVANDGDFVAAGYTKSRGTGADFLLTKISPGGNTLRWTKTWDGGGDDELYAIAESPDWTLWVTGYTTGYNLLGRKEAIAAKVSPSGATLTCARAGFASLSRDYCGMAVAPAIGGAVVVGTVSGPAIGQDILCLLANDAPSFQSALRIGDANVLETANGVQLTSDNGVVLGGFGDDQFSGRSAFLLKLDASFAFAWGRICGGPFPYTRQVQSLIKTGDTINEVVLVGCFVDSLLRDQVLLTKFSLAGTQLWSRGFLSADGAEGNAVTENDATDLVVAGAVAGYGAGGSDLLMAGCTSTGITCAPNVSGPTFAGWSPSTVSITMLVGGDVLTTSAWSHAWNNVSMTSAFVCPRTLTVCPTGPADFQRIQDAIAAAWDGDTIELCDATYEGPGNRDIDLLGKIITVRSASGKPESCVIDAYENPSQGHRGFYIHLGEGPATIVNGVTILRGRPPEDETDGGGIYCSGASPTIRNCHILDCDAQAGAGVYSYGSSPTLDNCRVQACGGSGGAAIEVCGGSATITACQITGNAAGGISFVLAQPSTIDHCTVVGNGLGMFAGGLAFFECSGNTSVTNSIVWGNCSPQIWCGGPEGGPWGCTVTSCCDVQGGWSGTNNINADPLFCDFEPCDHAPTICGDYHLCFASPCATGPGDCGLIGALPVAACSACSGDLNCDASVNFGDINAFVLALSNPSAWEDTYPCCSILGGDINGDCLVNFADINPFVNLLSGSPIPQCD